MLLNLPDQLPYSALWLESKFEARFSKLKHADFRIAFYYDYPDSSTFRYRVHNFIQAIDGLRSNSARTVSAAWFCKADGELINRLPDVVDVLVMCRARYSGQINRVISRCRNLGKKVLFDVDDLVFDNSHIHLVLETLGEDTYLESVWDHWFAYIGRIRETLNYCDGVITTNGFLARHVRELTGKAAVVIPNFINGEQLAASESLWRIKTDGGFRRDDRIHVGYFSGSPTHNRDFNLVSNVLADLMKSDRRIFLNLVGYLDPGDCFAKYQDRIQRLPMLDYINLQRVIAATEINIVPLQQNTFTNCKSELKFFEAAIVGTLTVASPTYAYARAISDQKTGWIAEEGHWEEKFNNAIETLRGKAEIYHHMAKEARRVALNQFSVAANRQSVFDALVE